MALTTATVLAAALVAQQAALPSAEDGSHIAKVEAERKALFNSVADGVVFVRCGEAIIGSGFFVHASGILVTNQHVVDCKGKIQVILRTGERKRAVVVARDSLYDLALMQIDAVGLNIRVLTLADSDLVAVGDYAAAVSHPVGGVWTLNDGIISNRYPARNDQYAGIIQTQVPLQPGSSGGPMFNRHGHVVGVVTAKLKSGDSTGFCIQSNLARRLLGDHLGASSAQLAVNGTVQGAEIVVDGKKRGAVPALLTLAPGTHTVEVRLKGKSLTTTVTLSKGGVGQVLVRREDLR